MAIIAHLRWRAVAVPFRAPLTTSRTSSRVRESVLFELGDDSGLTGLGEAALPAGSTLAEEGTALADAIASHARAMLGRPAEEAFRALERPRSRFGEWPVAVICGLETALADLAAKQQGGSLANWLANEAGIDRATIAESVAVNGLVDLADASVAVERACALVADGYRTVKLKCGGDPAGSLATVAAVRGAIGPGIELRCDANQAWSHDDAHAFLTGCEPFFVALCEEPLAEPGDDFGLLGTLRGETWVPLAVDESARTVEALDRALSAFSTDAVVVKPMFSGVRESLALLRRAREHELPAIVTTTFDLAPGTALALHLATLAGEPRMAHGLATAGLLESVLGSGLPEVDEGRMEVTRAAGLGISFDHDAIDHHATGPWQELRA